MFSAYVWIKTCVWLDLGIFIFMFSLRLAIFYFLFYEPMLWIVGFMNVIYGLYRFMNVI